MSLYNNRTLTINNQKLTTNEFQVDRLVTEQLTLSIDWNKKKNQDVKFLTEILKLKKK